MLRLITLTCALALAMPALAERSTDPDAAMTVTSVGPNAYVLSGSIVDGTCAVVKKGITARSPVVFMESPGGNSEEAFCSAVYLHDLGAQTIIANEKRTARTSDGKVEFSYTPVQYSLFEPLPAKKTVCASACTILFLAGTSRTIIGPVAFGLHGISYSDEVLDKIKSIDQKKFLIVSTTRTYNELRLTLERIGVKDDDILTMFFVVPGSSILWVTPSVMVEYPGLKNIATDYVDFYGMSSPRPWGGNS